MPATPAAVPAGPLGGVWETEPGSVAGFRLGETVLFLRSTVVERMSHVFGPLALSGEKVTSAVFGVNLRSMTVRSGR